MDRCDVELQRMKDIISCILMRKESLCAGCSRRIQRVCNEIIVYAVNEIGRYDE